MFIIGVDEAGRGALAGPVSVGVALVPRDFDWALIPGVRDSKQLSEKKREEIFLRARTLQKEGVLEYAVALVSAAIIDQRGITTAVRIGIARALKKLSHNIDDVEVRLDGLLHAPKEYIRQQTIIRGDQTEPAISLASIMAKVTRDRHMVALAKKYPAYALEVHKGYGTLVHRESIQRDGISDIHRRYFCRFANN